jgi:hypothetical protein
LPDEKKSQNLDETPEHLSEFGADIFPTVHLTVIRALAISLRKGGRDFEEF